MEEFEENFIPRITQTFHHDKSVNKVERKEIEKEVKALRKALGFISNKQTIINILCTKTNRQRLEIVKAYRSAYESDLIEEIKRKFPKSRFSKLTVALLTPIHDFYCNELYEALNEAGIDDDCLIQILCTLSNYDINEVCQRYEVTYEKILECDIRTGKMTLFYHQPTPLRNILFLQTQMATFESFCYRSYVRHVMNLKSLIFIRRELMQWN